MARRAAASHLQSYAAGQASCTAQEVYSISTDDPLREFQ